MIQVKMHKKDKKDQFYNITVERYVIIRSSYNNKEKRPRKNANRIIICSNPIFRG